MAFGGVSFENCMTPYFPMFFPRMPSPPHQSNFWGASPLKQKKIHIVLKKLLHLNFTQKNEKSIVALLVAALNLIVRGPPPFKPVFPPISPKNEQSLTCNILVTLTPKMKRIKYSYCLRG